ncbi:TPA: hypothetical protein ACOQ5N_003694 [Bacillus cereus]|nr:hypothetical protein [Bacillus cereus]HDR8510599.1 hypothetical protein [Bacillus cereus]HDR8534158.1 hypothetical protein [Bacillus cereus]HDX9676747.1 hypothetical protein [Bacillus cereus]
MFILVVAVILGLLAIATASRGTRKISFIFMGSSILVAFLYFYVYPGEVDELQNIIQSMEF